MTPIRAMLGILAVVAGLLVIYALFVDSSSAKLPLLVSGLAVLGIALAVLGFALAGSAVRQGELGRGGRALATSFVGGLFVLTAAGAFAGAIVLGILAAS